MWYNLKGMMLNGEELLRYREIQREDWAKEEEEEKEMAEFEELQDAACDASMTGSMTWLEGGSRI
jgi:hypothetical protein